MNEPWYENMNHDLDRMVWGITYSGGNGQSGAQTAGNKNKISLMRNIRDLRISQSPANYLGVLKINIDADRFFDGVMDVSGDQRNWIDLADSGNKVIYSSLPGNIGMDYRGMLKDPGEKAGSQLITIGGNKYMVVFDTIEPVGWKQLYFISFENYYENVGRMTFISTMAVLGVILVFIGISWFMAARFTKNIRNLSWVMGKVETGNFDIHVEETGKDEIGNLIAGFNKMTMRLKKLIDEAYKSKLIEKEYELQALQAQINPHFLYNILASISWLGLKYNAREVSDMANAIVQFYKNTLCGGRSMITAGQELEQIKSYIELQNMRYRNRLTVSYQWDEEMLPCAMMKFILQPFVENAIAHGIYDEKKSINVRIILEKSAGDLIWRVIDDGIGISPSKLESLLKHSSEKSSGYGIYNVDRRIRTYYGEDYGVSIFSRPGIGTAVHIRIPYNDDSAANNLKEAL